MTKELRLIDELGERGLRLFAIDSVKPVIMYLKKYYSNQGIVSNFDYDRYLEVAKGFALGVADLEEVKFLRKKIEVVNSFVIHHRTYYFTWDCARALLYCLSYDIKEVAKVFLHIERLTNWKLK